MAHKIMPDKCIACGTCDVECPFHAVVISPEGKFSIDEKKCRNCGICASVCPVDAAVAGDCKKSADSDGKQA